MTDTARTYAALQSIFADGQLPGSITEQDTRDLILSYDQTQVINVQHPSYGALGNGTHDDTAAFVAAVAAAPVYGALIVMPPGRYLWTSEVVCTKPIIFIGLCPGYGPTNTSNSNEKGSYILLGANISGAMIRFATPASGIAGQGSGIRNVGFFGNGRAFTVGSAVHVENANTFRMEDVAFEQVKGRGLRVSASIKSDFNKVYLSQCGDTALPAVDLDPSGLNFVQGSSFTQFKVETCYNAEYFKCSANVQTNKFDDLGFEGLPSDSTTLQKYFAMGGDRNQIGKIHVNQSDSTATVPKIDVSGNRNVFSNVLIAGKRSSTAGQLSVSGQFNQFGVIEDFGLQTFTETYKSIIVSGPGNHIDAVNAEYSGEVTLSGDYNTIGTYKSFSGAGQFLLSGQYCSVEDLFFQGSTYAGDLVAISGTRSEAKVRVITAASATSAVKVSSSGKVLPGSFLQNITNGHGVWFSNNLGSADGVVMNIIGKHGFFVDECEPRRIANCEVRDCSSLTPSTYDAYSFNSAATTRSTGGVLSGNTALMTTATHRHAFFSTDNAGTPRFQNWVIAGNNHAAGGDFSWSTGTNIIANNRS